jgi:CelD/BcsL family acetyltransferase involved in cellulose biosynthesis
LHTQSEAFALLQPYWNALLRRSASDLIFLTYEWQSVWWNAYQAGELYIVTVHEGETLIAIAPWFIQDRDGQRVIRTLGCVDVTDYVDIIADHDHLDEAHRALAAFLAQHKADFDRINLCNIPEASPTYALFPDHLRQHDFDADLLEQEVCPIIRLPGDWETYLSMLDKKQRHELRRKLRRAEAEADLTYYLVNETHDFTAEAERFLALMAASQPSKAAFLADAQNETFFRRVLVAMRDAGWLRLSFLLVDGEPAAAYCDFDYNNQIQVYNSGLNPNVSPHLSPGIVLLCYNIQQAIADGRTVYDFLRGNETYKYRMGAQDTRVYKLVARLRQVTPAAV